METGASPLTELDLLDDDTFCSSVSETPYRRRGRRHRRAPEVHYGMYDPYRPPQAFYYAPPMMMPPPPPPPRPTDDYYQQAQAQAPSNIHWAQPPPPPPPAPQPPPVSWAELARLAAASWGAWALHATDALVVELYALARAFGYSYDSASDALLAALRARAAPARPPDKCARVPKPKRAQCYAIQEP